MGGGSLAAVDGNSLAVCGGIQRHRFVFTSRSNHVQLRVVPSVKMRFLLRFEGWLICTKLMKFGSCRTSRFSVTIQFTAEKAYYTDSVSIHVVATSNKYKSWKIVKHFLVENHFITYYIADGYIDVNYAVFIFYLCTLPVPLTKIKKKNSNNKIQMQIQMRICRALLTICSGALTKCQNAM